MSHSRQCREVSYRSEPGAVDHNLPVVRRYAASKLRKPRKEYRYTRQKLQVAIHKNSSFQRLLPTLRYMGSSFVPFPYEGQEAIIDRIRYALHTQSIVKSNAVEQVVADDDEDC